MMNESNGDGTDMYKRRELDTPIPMLPETNKLYKRQTVAEHIITRVDLNWIEYAKILCQGMAEHADVVVKQHMLRNCVLEYTINQIHGLSGELSSDEGRMFFEHNLVTIQSRDSGRMFRNDRSYRIIAIKDDGIVSLCDNVYIEPLWADVDMDGEYAEVTKLW